jgi:hypothetical protein
MTNPRQTIHIHPGAPQKPSEGRPCNGCGVCCLTEPCPLGVLLSGRRQGACKALRWSEGGLVYRCGAINEPKDVLSRALPQWLRPIATGLSPLMARLAKRWIAVGQGCDSSLEVASVAGSSSPPGISPTISSTFTELPVRHHPSPDHHHDKPTSTLREF